MSRGPLSPPELSLLRALDASFDRLTEALRVVEDQLRFAGSLRTLPGRFKALRHEAAKISREVELAAGAPLAVFRDVGSDAGRPAGTDIADDNAYRSSPRRSGQGDLIGANCARAREAIRSIEESLRAFSRAPDELVHRAETLRYAIYADEAVAIGLSRRSGRLADANLYVLVTTELCAGDPRDITRAAVRGGAQLIQLREKSMAKREFLSLARELREITAAEGALFIVNDAIDIAQLCGADGVHQGQEDLPPAEVRKLLGPDAIIGISTHCPEDAARAEADGADYIGVGPIFETKTKEHRRSVGLDYIAGASQASSIPGFAIGSVNRSTIDEVIRAGAERVAICTGVIAADDAEAAARWFRAKLDAAGAELETRPAPPPEEA